jgi:hypothetical protein
MFGKNNQPECNCTKPEIDVMGICEKCAKPVKTSGGPQLPANVRVLVINYDMKTNQIGIQGCIGEKLLCLGMLECAKQAVVDFNKDQEEKAKKAAVEEASRILKP